MVQKIPLNTKRLANIYSAVLVRVSQGLSKSASQDMFNQSCLFYTKSFSLVRFETVELKRCHWFDRKQHLKNATAVKTCVAYLSCKHTANSERASTRWRTEWKIAKNCSVCTCMKVYANSKQGTADGHQGLGMVTGIQWDPSYPLMKRVHQKGTQTCDTHNKMQEAIKKEKSSCVLWAHFTKQAAKQKVKWTVAVENK